MKRLKNFLTAIAILLACSMTAVAGDYIVGEPMRASIIQALTGTAGALPVANGGTGATTAATARTNLGITATSVPKVIPSSLNLGTSYELQNYYGRVVLALTRWKTFGRISRSYTLAGAGTENGWTLESTFNTTNLSAANENTTTPGALRLAHKAVVTAWNTGTRNAPLMYRTVQANAGQMTVITTRVKVNNQAFTGQQAGIIVTQGDALNTMAAAWCGMIAGVHQCEGYTGSSGTSGSLGSAALSAGIWLQIAIRNGVTAESRYSTAVQTTPPTNWTPLQTGIGVLSTPDKLFRIGIVMLGSASGTYTADFTYFDTRVYQDPMVYNGIDLPDDSAAQGYDSTSPAIQLIADWDIGVLGTPSQTLLRSILASAVNPVDESRTSSTWTFSGVCSANVGASPGSYSAASVMTLTTTGRYCNLWAKATSDSYNPATLDISSIYIPVTP